MFIVKAICFVFSFWREQKIEFYSLVLENCCDININIYVVLNSFRNIETMNQHLETSLLYSNNECDRLH